MDRESLRRWAPFALAAVASVLAVLVFWTVADGLVAPRSLPSPQLRSIPPATLASMGITLAGAAQPPYCGLAGGVAQRGVVGQGTLGCAITRDAAETAAKQGSSTVRVVESVLARVTYTHQPGHPDQLMWVVVTQGSPMGMPGSFSIAWRGVPPLRSNLVLVDAHTAEVTPVPIWRARGGSVRQVPGPRPPTLPATTTAS
jgi:hypothetical protein